MIRCALCGGPIRRRWWEWWVLRPVGVHDWRDEALCRARSGHPAGSAHRHT